VVAIAARADPSTPEGNKESRPKRIKQLSSCRHINACFQREELTTTFGRFMHAKRHQRPKTTMKKLHLDLDNLHHHKAIRVPDADKFKEAMVKEWVDQREDGTLVLGKTI